MTTVPGTTTPTPDDVDPVDVDELRSEISKDLRDLTAEADLVSRLKSTHPRGLGFLTADAKAALVASARHELEARSARRRPAHEQLGHAWFVRPTEVSGPGTTDAPLNVTAASAYTTAARDLRRLVRYLTRVLYEEGLCTLQQLHDRPRFHEVTDHLRNLAMHVESPAALLDVREALEPLVEAFRRVIDGNDRSLLNDACPHCGRKTLVVFWAQFLIRCDKPTDSIHFQPCTCPDPLCECKRRPVAFRHQWLLDKPAKSPDSWRALAGRLNINRSISEEPTR